MSSLWHALAVLYAALPAVAWLVLAYAALDDVLDLGLLARIKGLRALLDITNYAYVVAHDYGTQAAVRVAIAAFAATFVATSNPKQAFFYALAAGAAAELPNLKADALSKLKLLLDSRATAAQLKPFDNIPCC